MGNINEIPLSKTTKFIVDNRGKTVPTSPTGIKLIATNCIDNKNLYPVYENLRFLTQDTFDTWFRAHPQPGDIILTLKGSQNGAACLVPDIVDFAIAQDMVALRPDEKIIDPLYLFAALRSNEVQTQIKNLDVSGVIPHLKKSDFDKLLIPFPDPSLQKFIGEIYFYLSKKADLLHRQNATLEKMAETLFRQWFVEEAKEEWEVGKIGDFVTTNEFSLVRDYPFEEIEYLDTSSLNKGLISNIQKLEIRDAPSRARRLVKHNDILISTVRPDQKHYGIIKEPKENLVVSTGFCVISCKNISPHFVYLFLTTNEMTEYLHSIAEGSTSTYPSLKPSDLEKIEFLIPPREKLNDFEKLATNIFQKVKSNQTQIRTLTALRDTLLPKLMSGEVRVL